ncbi:MAG TPA: peptidylprolyl isomerase [Bacteroidota bacterium]|nr:peptidylprolyl isomerase [Bacteroidota bacterium]
MKYLPGAFLIVVIALLSGGCSTEPAGTVIARVGDSVLTLEEAGAALDSSSENFGERLNRYAAAWVNSELLYQEALRLGIGSDPGFEARMDAVRRQLASQELLDRLIYGDTVSFGDDVLRSYFTSHPDEFTIAENHLKLRLATFRGRETARKFASSVTPSKTWASLLDSMGNDPRASQEIVSSTPERWYTRSTIYPPELWKVAGPLGPGEASFPLKTDGGYTVLHYLALAPEGKTDEFDLVRDEVFNRVLIESRRSRLESLLGTLRERYGVEMNANDATRQEGSAESNE